MEEMLKVLVRDIVDNPDAVSVTTRVEDKANVLELRVDPADMGKVIGKQGKIAKAIRTLMKAYATKNGTKINVEIID